MSLKNCLQGGKQMSTYNLNYTAQKILQPEEVFPYSELIMSKYEYPNPGILDRPFVGLKIRLTDYDANRMTPEMRIAYLEQNLRQILNGTGCIMRETSMQQAMDGLFLITLPVPINQLDDINCNQIKRALVVLDALDRNFNICIDTQTDKSLPPKIYFEINISGYCPLHERQDRLSTIRIPTNYASMFIPQQSVYTVGNVIPINDMYALLRTQWALPFYNGNLGGNYENLKRMVLDVTSALSTAFK